MIEPAKPGLPMNTGEVATAMVHYYRAEMARMAGWRDRLDRTSNWAITVVAAMLSVSLSTPTAHHGVLLFAILLISLLLFVEGRRYRFFDVYRMRVRQFERHYFGQLFSGDAEGGKEPWLVMLAQDLRHPKFRISLRLALRRRLKRNYIWMYLILLLAWVLKITSPRLQEEGATIDAPRSVATVIEQAALGALPGWVVIAAIAVTYLVLALLILRGREIRSDDEVHV
jgi:uncharacterized membrane protein